MSNFQVKEHNPWNPFLPTKRDIQRTEELSKKNHVVAGLLTFLLLPVGMIYLNRGVNSLKILGYVFIFAFLVGIVSDTEETAEGAANVVGLAGSIALIAESANCVIQARNRSRN
ncbi:MAG: hypothetical protein ACFCAD_13825 [Pleurocapsa sp.]